uniref:Uncharacterized protein n=1 Tax=Periophthalmus magnuspinnatus TaxID=409849 RepID=A0A3B4A5J3_9GOBI
MPSMDSPFSSFFSISTISLTPSTTSCTWYTSEEPRRSALEMSNTPPTEAVSTPPVHNNVIRRGLCKAVWSESPQTWRVCLCPGWRGRSGCSQDARST